MISIKEALQILQDNLPATKTEVVELPDAYDRYLAEKIMAPEPSPRFTNSAMDGYAVRWQDIMGASIERPAALRIVGESRAGLSFDQELKANEAVHISTGAMLPVGADTVVRVEDTLKGAPQTVEIVKARSQGQDVRYQGEEFVAGDELLVAGSRLTTRQLALLAAVGRQQVQVYTLPLVAVLVTGSELATAGGQEIKADQVRDSNSIMLRSALREAGAAIHSCRHIADELQPTIDGIGSSLAAGKVDIIICSGGVSVGEHDHVKEAAARVGFKELFWRIRQKPGKPLFAAQQGKTYLFGLPGNPVSAFMCFTHYIRPLILTMLGQEMSWKTLTARAGNDIANHGKRTNFIRVRMQQQRGRLPRIVDIDKQGSHMLSSIVNADGYIILEAGETIRSRDLVEVFLF